MGSFKSYPRYRGTISVAIHASGHLARAPPCILGFLHVPVPVPDQCWGALAAGVRVHARDDGPARARGGARYAYY